jgi:protease PrsW
MRYLPLWLRWLLAALVVGSVGAGALLDVWMRGHTPREVQARWAIRAGDPQRAAALYLEELRAGPVTVPLVVAFLDAQAQTGSHHARRAGHEDDDDDTLRTFDHGRRHEAVSLAEHAIDELLAKDGLAPDVALLGRFWRHVHLGAAGVEELSRVEAAADATPPLPWANHLLARTAILQGDRTLAAKRYAREGLAFDRKEDIAIVLGMLEHEGDWEGIGRELADAHVARLAAPWVRFRYAVQVKDWSTAARLSFRVAYEGRFTASACLLAAVSFFAWFAFCLRLGRVSERWSVRLPIFLVAPVLGGLSVVPTDAFIALEECYLHLEPTGDMARDALFFLFGVGFREELSKLLLFAPLVPILRRAAATKLDVLVAGALVGLGFATVENLAYFASADLTNAMARFLTANFLHMAMTGLTAAALWDGARDPDRATFDASKTFLGVVALHGAYDFFLSAPGGMSYLAMIVFLVLARQFTSQVHEVRGRAGRGPSLLDVFVLGSACIACVSFVYAAAMVGPRLAAAALLEGMIGLFIIAFFFVQELRRL